MPQQLPLPLQPSPCWPRCSNIVALPHADELTDHPGTRVLALGAAPLHVDSATLLALLRGYPIVGASWQASCVLQPHVTLPSPAGAAWS